MRFKASGRSAAIVVAAFTVAALIGGVAVADRSATTSAPAKKVAKKALKKSKKALQVAKAAEKEQGPQGIKGESGATDVTTRTGQGVSVLHGSTNTATATCSTGERATGGGYDLSGSIGDVHPYASHPGAGDPPTTWTVEVSNDTQYAGNALITPYVVCAAP